MWSGDVETKHKDREYYMSLTFPFWSTDRLIDRPTDRLNGPEKGPDQTIYGQCLSRDPVMEILLNERRVYASFMRVRLPL